MKSRFFERKAEHGFRISIADVCFISMIGVISAVLYFTLKSAEIAFIPVHLCAVFFLFCNVFRVRTRQEVLWMVTYVIAAAYSMRTGIEFWPLVLGVTTPMIIVVVYWAVISGGYKGIWSR